MYKEMPVIPVNKVVDKKIIIGKNGGQRRRRGIHTVDTDPKKVTVSGVELADSRLKNCQWLRQKPKRRIVKTYARRHWCLQISRSRGCKAKPDSSFAAKQKIPS
jgi:hypothetical protein